MSYYLVLRVISTPLLLLVLHQESTALGTEHSTSAKFIILASSRPTSRVRSCCSSFALKSSAPRCRRFPGITKLAIVIFRWAAVVSVIVSLTSISYAHKGIYIIADISYGLMHSVSVLELCLLAFLCLSMNALRLTVRDLSFGIALGFGLMCSADFILSSWISRMSSLTDPMQFVYESMILVTLAIWVVYCVMPEPARKPVLMSASSTIYRWNEIASALGHTGTRVAVQQPANSFFLSDVERVVEKVLARNMKGRESKT